MRRLKELGFRFVTLDLEGFRSGSLNTLVNLEIKRLFSPTSAMKTEPLPAAQALEAYFLEARSKLLDLAAMLDRIDRGGGAVRRWKTTRDWRRCARRWRCCTTGAAAGRSGFRRYFRSIMI